MRTSFHTIVVQIGVFLFASIETLNAFYSPQDRYKNLQGLMWTSPFQTCLLLRGATSVPPLLSASLRIELAVE